jgi:hypothetical protein
MNKLIKKNKQLIIINAIFTALVVAQETHLIDVFPIDDQWKVPIKGIILFSISAYNAVKLTLQNLSDK